MTTESTAPPTVHTAGTSNGSSVLRWAPLLALVWSLVYGLLGLFWANGGSGFPYGPAGDPSAELSLLARTTAEGTGPVIALVGLVGVVTAAAMIAGWNTVPSRWILLGVAAVMALTLTLLLPDYRVLMTVAYTPILLIGYLFGWPEGFSLGDVYPWEVVNQFILIAGGLVWAGAALNFWRGSRSACLACGRIYGPAGSSPERLERWGRWATGVAVAIPLFYAATRFAWALGIPLGISTEFLREGQESGLWVAGAALASAAVIGAVLTMGLIRPWGEVFPRWIPFLAGKRVPPKAATIPASIVAAIVTSAGLMFVRLTLGGTFAIAGENLVDADNWAAIAPELLWPLWGVALATATLAYHYRRPGRCDLCGRVG